MENELSPGWLGRRPPSAWVLGMGLIGGSWAGALSARGWRVVGYDRDKTSLATATGWGWIREGCSVLPAHINADLIVLALPLPVLLPAMDDLRTRINPGTVVTDVCSLKTQVAEKALRFSEQGAFFIGGHPMTGSEKSGFPAATPDLFKGYPYVLTPDAAVPAEAVQGLAKLIKEMGAKVVLRSPGDHDREVAMVSHLPHILAVAMAQSVRDLESAQNLDPMLLAGRSFREMTRIADSSPEMWRDIFLNNRENILAGLDFLEQRLERFKACLRQSDGAGIEEAFLEAQSVRKKLS